VASVLRWMLVSICIISVIISVWLAVLHSGCSSTTISFWKGVETWWVITIDLSISGGFRFLYKYNTIQSWLVDNSED